MPRGLCRKLASYTAPKALLREMPVADPNEDVRIHPLIPGTHALTLLDEFFFIKKGERDFLMKKTSWLIVIRIHV